MIADDFYVLKGMHYMKKSSVIQWYTLFENKKYSLLTNKMK